MIAAEKEIAVGMRDVADLRHGYAERGWLTLAGLVCGEELQKIRQLIAEADRGGKFRVGKNGVQADQATALENLDRAAYFVFTHGAISARTDAADASASVKVAPSTVTWPILRPGRACDFPYK